jgi:phage baseplate assembly protein W
MQRLGAGDFISTTGIKLVRAAIIQIVGTQRSEIQWRPSFGTRTAKFKNKANTDGLAALLEDDIETSIKQFEPRISSVQVNVKNQDNLLIATIVWSVIDKNTPNNQVIVGPDSFEVIL